MTVVDVDPRALVPGAMEHTLRRVLPGLGLIEFEQAPIGWLKKDGQPRRAAWRAYHWTPEGGKRTRLPSVTTILDDILPKDGLPRWAEAHGIRGAITAVRQGLVSDAVVADDVVDIVRKARLGADAAKDDAADRGLNVHDFLETYMRTGTPPALRGAPVAHRGFITGLTNFLLDYDPEPVAVEQLVVDPAGGYAGRLDLRARIPRICAGLTTTDLKTQVNAAIYPGAHFQVGMYERAARACGDEPADRLLVVVVSEDGQYRVMPADHPTHIVDAALLFRRLLKPIDSACETANRRERDARREAIAA
jgi:hypothetical protein